MQVSRFFLITFILLFLIPSCDKENPRTDNRVIIGISTDIESLNPMYAISTTEGNIIELIYMSLFRFRWDESAGNLKEYPMLAESWEWGNRKTHINIKLREGISWSDGEPLTAEDVIFTFDLYSDPLTESVRLGFFENFYTDDEDHIDLSRTFKSDDPYNLTIYFPPNAEPGFYDIDLPIIPKHIYENIDRESIPTAEENILPVTSGPYGLGEWKRNEFIRLVRNNSNYLVVDDTIEELIFKVIPDYSSRINQLRKSEIDLMEDIKPSDVDDLIKDYKIRIEPLKGREYDYIGWNNLEPSDFNNNGRLTPHRLFGNKNVRRALTMAVNRREILEEYLINFGELSSGPVAPIFKNMVNRNKEAYPYDPSEAKRLLEKEGWMDTDMNGVLDRSGQEFRFTMYIPSGNPRREFAATVFKNNLASIGVNTDIEFMELGTFIGNLYERKLDAWMLGWSVPIPVELKPYWYSDFDSAPLNFPGYRNAEVDRLLNAVESSPSESEKNATVRVIDSLIHSDEPVSFLYWIDNIVGYNPRIKNIRINPLGIVHYSWEWKIE